MPYLIPNDFCGYTFTVQVPRTHYFSFLRHCHQSGYPQKHTITAVDRLSPINPYQSGMAPRNFDLGRTGI